jgi:UDP:flavonoid glycosyltransferase YjiC (YdhE family)
MLQVVLDALSDLDVTVVAATAGHGRISRQPANAYLADFLPGTAAAARAALVICNGGSPTTYQALASGVPVLALASNNMDQHLNMAAVAKANAGVVLRARGVTKEGVRATAAAMLGNPWYRDGLSVIASAHRACRVDERFPALLDELVAATTAGVCRGRL